MQLGSADHSSSDTGTGRPRLDPGCIQWLLVAAAVGIAGGIAASLAMSARADLLAVILGILVYIGGAVAVALFTRSAAIGSGLRRALIMFLPLPVAAAVWYGLSLLGF